MQRIIRVPRLAVNYVILSGAEFISKLLAAVALAYLARMLGPQSYGYLEFAIALYFIFSILVDSGLGPYGARELAKEAGKLPHLFTHITFARSILAFITFSILGLIALFIDQPMQVKTLILLYGLVMFILPVLIQWVFQGKDLMQYVAAASLIRWSVFLAAVILLVHASDQLWIVPLIEGFALICVATFLLASLVQNFGLPRNRLSLPEAFAMFRTAFPIGASALVWAVRVYFATILLGFVVGGSELGWFAAAHRIIVALHAFVWLYFYNMLPSISRSTKQPPEVLQRLMRFSLRVTAWAGVLAGIYGIAFAQFGITLIFGPQFQESGQVFQIAIWLIPLALMSGHFRYILVGYNQQQYEFYSALIGAVVNISLNLVMVPRLGIIGAAWALIISEGVIWLAAYYFVRRTVTVIPVLVNIWKALLAGLALAALLYFLVPFNLWFAGAIGLLLYGVLFIALEPDFRLRFQTLFSRKAAE